MCIQVTLHGLTGYTWEYVYMYIYIYICNNTWWKLATSLKEGIRRRKEKKEVLYVKYNLISKQANRKENLIVLNGKGINVDYDKLKSTTS